MSEAPRKFMTTTQVATDAIRLEAHYLFNELALSDVRAFNYAFEGVPIANLSPQKVREAYNWLVRRIKRRDKQKDLDA